MENGTKVILKIHRGKLCFPSDYSVSNGDSLILTRNAFALFSIALYTVEQWILFKEALIDATTSTGGVSGDLTRQVLANAAECIGKECEINIPSHLLKLADLKNEALWIQGETRVELWDPERFAKQL